MMQRKSKVSKNVDHINEPCHSAATSGKEFSGERFRTFTPRVFKNKPVRKVAHKNINQRNCTKWAVVTTIFSPPQESVRRLLYRLDWCVVVVGDKDKPQVSFLQRNFSGIRVCFSSLETI